jgi:hypothetical protein
MPADGGRRRTRWSSYVDDLGIAKRSPIADYHGTGETSQSAGQLTALGFAGRGDGGRDCHGQAPVNRFVACAGRFADVDRQRFEVASWQTVTGRRTNPSIAEAIMAGLAAAGITPSVLTFEGGHRMDRLTLEGIAEN